MRASTSFFFVACLALSPACGGSEFSDEPGAAGGSGGASAGGSGGSSGSSAGGSEGGAAGGEQQGGASGSSGEAGASGQQGGEAGASGASGSGGEQGGSGGGGGSAGQQGGAAGSSGQQGGQGGQGGEAGASGGAGGGCAAGCEQPADPCGKAVCQGDTCMLVPNDGYMPLQTLGDCHKNVCSGTMTVAEIDDTDTPVPAGKCDAVLCDNGSPKHLDSSSLCAPTEICKSGSCICQPCPDVVAGLGNTACRLPGGTDASASNQADGHPASMAVDGSGSTWWQSGNVATSETLTLDLGKTTGMTGVTIFPRLFGTGAAMVSYSVTVTTADGATEVVSSGTKTMPINAPEPVVLQLSGPRAVTMLQIKVTTVGSPAAIDEVTFLTGC